jgi:hypothetical protein
MFKGSVEALQAIGPIGVAYSSLLTDKTKVSFSPYIPEKIPKRRDKGLKSTEHRHAC